jgi:hypothetical protein
MQQLPGFSPPWISVTLGTRKDDQLLSADEVRAIADIRQGVGAMDSLAWVCTAFWRA